MKIKTSELIGPALDWAVAKCEGVEYRFIKSTGGDYNGNWWWETRRYSTNWDQGGSIIEKEKISTKDFPMDWEAYNRRTGIRVSGPTLLIAAMRCYCCSKLGDEVDIPEELS